MLKKKLEMNYCKTLLLFPIILMHGLTQAQGIEYSRFETREVNTNYIVDYSDQLLVKVFGILKSNAITHKDNFTDKSIEYKPNEDFNIGFGIGYKAFGLDLAFNILNSNKDNDVFGKTKRFDVQSNLYLRKFLVDFNMQFYKGYYGFNPEDYKPGFDRQNPVYPIRPDMKSVNISISALYVFKHDKFSFRSAFTYNERQIKGTGSFLAGPYFGYFRMDADSTIVPVEVRDTFNPEADFRGTKFTRFGISGGYAHNFVIGKRVFFSTTMVIGLGPEITRTPALDMRPANNEVKVAARVGFRAALGYNSEKFFTGMAAVTEVSGGDDNEAVLERSVSNFKIFIGKRFNPPKFLTK